MPAAAADPRAPLFVVAAATLWGTRVAVGSARNLVGALVLVAGAAPRSRSRAPKSALPPLDR